MTELCSYNNTATVVIPTHNAGQRFSGLLDSLETQTLKPAQIIIIDSESTDETCEVAKRRNCKVITINRADFDHGTSRNLAAAHADTEFIVFLTQDVTSADNKTLEELIKPLQTDSNIAICYGRQLSRPNAGSLERFYREFNYPQQSILKTKNSISDLGLKTFFCSNCFTAIRRSTFNELGGFKNGAIVNEDMLYAATAICAGYAVYYNAKAMVYHSHSYQLLGTLRRYFNIGRFFADNRWVLQYTGLKSYGIEMLRHGAQTFWQKRTPHNIATLVVDLTLKTIGYKLGWYYQLWHQKNEP